MLTPKLSIPLIGQLPNVHRRAPQPTNSAAHVLPRVSAAGRRRGALRGALPRASALAGGRARAVPRGHRCRLEGARQAPAQARARGDGPGRVGGLVHGAGEVWRMMELSL